MRIEMNRDELGEAATKWVVDRLKLVDGQHDVTVRIHEKAGGATVDIRDAAFTADDELTDEQLDELGVEG